MSNQDLKILCVDDEDGILELYESAIKKAGFTPLVTSDPKQAIEIFNANMPNLVLVLSDYQMPEMNGFEFRKSIMKDGQAVPFVMVSAYVTKEMALEALDLKISAFFDKPVKADDVIKIVTKETAVRLQYIRECQALEGIFVDEASTILDEIEPVLLSLEHERVNPEAINAIFRGAHTLKGSSGCLYSDVVTRYVHKYEDIISGLKKGQLTLTDEIYEVLFKGLDRIKLLIASVPGKTLHLFKLDEILPELALKSELPKGVASKTESTLQTAQPKADTKPKGKDTISVPVNMLDELSGYSGEITVIRNMVNKIVRSLEVRYAGNKDIQSLGELLEEMHKINSTIQVRITDLRKVPLSGVLKPIPRTIRDLSRDLSKNIKLNIEGENLRVDSSLAAVCSNSLIHLVRNSADHGIEMPSDRVASGKPETGTVNIICTEEHDEVHIKIRDDGRGIDHLKIRAKALEKGLFTEQQLAEMSEQQALGIIFASGFSTAAKVTDVSGRGVGMDMVKSSVESVGGQIDIESKPGFGSTFNLKLPVPKSVLIINSLLVKSGSHSIAVPQDSIIRVLRIEKAHFQEMIQDAASGVVLRCDNIIYPLIELKAVLGIVDVETQNPDIIEVLILKSDKTFYALRVDGILDSEEIVVKRLQPCFNPHGVYAGATFLGDGSVGLIIDVRGLADLAGVSNQAAAQKSVAPADNIVPSTMASYLLFNVDSKALYGAPLEQVFRLEEIDGHKVQRCGAERVVIYRERVMPIYSVGRLLKLPLPEQVPNSAMKDRISVIVAKGKDGFVGYEVSNVVDIASSDQKVSDEIRDREGVSGNTFIGDHTVTILDLPLVLESVVNTRKFY